MTPMTIVVHPEEVDKILRENGLEIGSAPITHAMLQGGSAMATAEGKPSPNAALLLVIEVDGKPVLAKTTLRLMELAIKAMRSIHGPHVDTDVPDSGTGGTTH